MVTTIQISEKLQQALQARKVFDRASYEDVIWDLIEDTMELSEETKKAIKQAEKEFAQGKFITHEQLCKELGIK